MASITELFHRMFNSAAGALRVELVGGGSGGDALPIADPAGIVTSTVTPDPISGADTMTVVVFPKEQAVIAVKIAGDDFPRWLLSADPTDYGLLMGDGTYDPADVNGPSISIDSSGGIEITAGNQGAHPVIQLAGDIFTRRTVEFGGSTSHPESIILFGTHDGPDPNYQVRIDGGTTYGPGDGTYPVSIDYVGGVWTVPNLPTADPHVAGQWWANSGVVTVSAG